MISTEKEHSPKRFANFRIWVIMKNCTALTRYRPSAAPNIFLGLLRFRISHRRATNVRQQPRAAHHGSREVDVDLVTVDAWFAKEDLTVSPTKETDFVIMEDGTKQGSRI